jgi:predicted enzyme related to lactoylglutathione lyase
MPMQEPLLSMGHPSAWTTYLATDDAAATAARVTAAGGTLMQEPIEVMEHGVMAIGTDVTQAGFGLWQAKAHIGFQLANAANAVTWNEMMSRDFEKAKAFYAAVFGYTYTDMSADGFKYATIEVGGNTVGGIGELPAEVPAEVPAHWRVYFDVDDADKAAAQVVELGGQVISPPRDMPYGRYADVTDAQGGHFSVIKSAQPA